MNAAELLRRFRYHAPDESTRQLHDKLREMELAHAAALNDVIRLTCVNPDRGTRETSLMWTALEEAGFWAHAHIARNVSGRIEDVPPAKPQDAHVK